MRDRDRVTASLLRLLEEIVQVCVMCDGVIRGYQVKEEGSTYLFLSLFFLPSFHRFLSLYDPLHCMTHSSSLIFLPLKRYISLFPSFSLTSSISLPLTLTPLPLYLLPSPSSPTSTSTSPYSTQSKDYLLCLVLKLTPRSLQFVLQSGRLAARLLALPEGPQK